MFTWICPKCGREVPPAYTECPDCSRKEAAPESAAAPPPTAQSRPPEYTPQAPPHPEPPPFQPPPAYPAPPQQAPYQPPMVYAPPPPRGGLPTWALTLLFAFAFFGLGAGIYWLVGGARGANPKPAAAVESPAAKPGARPSPYQKYIEISGVRFLEDAKKKPQARFVVINHSGADILGLGGNVTIWGRTRNSEEDAAGTFTFQTDLKGFESKEMTAPLNTRLKMYELPDWQNVSADVQITSPASQ